MDTEPALSAAPTGSQVELAHGLLQMHTERHADANCAWCHVPHPCGERQWADSIVASALEAGNGQ